MCFRSPSSLRFLTRLLYQFPKVAPEIYYIYIKYYHDRDDSIHICILRLFYIILMLIRLPFCHNRILAACIALHNLVGSTIQFPVENYSFTVAYSSWANGTIERISLDISKRFSVLLQWKCAFLNTSECELSEKKV